MAMTDAPDPVRYYTDLVKASSTAHRLLLVRARWLSWARLAVACLMVASLYYGYRAENAALGWAGALTSLALFVFLVRAHSRVATAAAHAHSTVAAGSAGIARCERDWANMPEARFVDLAAHPTPSARDLGILGEVSLFRLLDVASPALGSARLLEWLLADPADLLTMQQRQQSVIDLRHRPDYLRESAVAGRHGSYARTAASSAALRGFLAWCGESPGRRDRWRRVSLLAMACSLLLALLAAWRPPWFAPLAIVVTALQLYVATRARRHLMQAMAGLDTLLPQLRGLDASMRLIADETDVAGMFGNVQRSLRNDGAPGSLAALDAILRWNEVRLTPMAHFPLNALFGLDVHIAAALEGWKTQYGAHVARWVEQTSGAQALTALATLAYENPGWSMPLIHDASDAPVFHADAIVHPLLPATGSVANDVRIDGPGSLVALSGSNMSGKTTYLRAIGLNAALAFAGGPVSAGSVVLRRARLRTSVRIEDDLGAGVSLFLAEVTRLRDIVSDGESDGAPVLFLFDEILHGTNADDRRYASQVVLRRLLSAGNWGVLTTHDADLVTDLFDANEPLRRAGIAQGHFRESVAREDDVVRMSFDYRLRPGPTTSANARVILEMMGLGVPTVGRFAVFPATTG